jgi:hypothetical protein
MSARGEAYVFNATSGEYLGSLLGSDSKEGDEFGQSVGISGNLILISAENANGGQGAGYLFDATTLQQLRILSADDPNLSEVGDTVAISGNHALLGGSESVFLFDASTGALRSRITISGGGAFGTALAARDDRAVAGAPKVNEELGAAFLIDLNTANIVRTFLPSDGQPNDEFGDAVSIDGSLVLVASANVNDDAGAVYVFDAVTGLQIAKWVSPNEMADEEFGKSVAISNGRALIGAESGVVDGQGSGVAYVFDIDIAGLADVDDNGTVDVADIDAITAAVRSGSTDLDFDVNHDNTVNVDDRVLWIAALNHTYFGDANLDGEFNSSDLVAVLASGVYEDAIQGNGSWATGDWDGDGDVTSSDLVVALSDGGYEQGLRHVVAVVPEPSAATIVMSGVLALGIRCRVRRLS